MVTNTIRKQKAAKVSVISNTCLVFSKLVAGILSGSVGIISEAIHSGIDLAASVVAYYSIKIASIPEDEDHQYGHGKYEDISGLAEAILILVAAFFIAHEAFSRLLSEEQVHIQTTLGLIVMFISFVTNIVVSKYLFKVAKEEDSIALLADAQHLQADVYTSAGVFVSLLIIAITGWVWVDAASAIGIAALIGYMAFRLTKRAFDNLVDIKLPEEEEEQIRSILTRYDSEIISVHKFRTRKSGAIRFVDFHLIIKGDLTIKEGHLLTDLIEEDIRNIFPGTKIYIHLEPCTDDCPECHIYIQDPKSCKKIRDNCSNTENNLST